MVVQQEVHPNFFIIGAPKSGTTALSEYLRQHPNILFSEPKEPHFFNDDFSHRHIDTFESYLKCFAQSIGQEQAIGEGSVFYLYSQTAVSNILRCYPDAQFIVMLRNPVEAVYSWHWEVMYSHGEDLEDFEAAWRAQKRRRQGEMLPRSNRVREALHYGPLFSYADQVQRLLDQVPKARVQVILYDDLKKDPELVYQKTLRFLSLSPHQLEQYNRINPSKRLRWSWVERTIRSAGNIKRAIGITKRVGMLTRLQLWNTKYQEKPPLRVDFRSELAEYFRDDVLRTAELIDQDLSEWIND